MNGDDARARLAAANNADVYAAVFAAHGLRFHRDAGLFRAIDPPPPYYSSLTTLDPDETARQLAALDALRAEGRADLGIKDGFCRLDPDLAARGLRVLFEASWLWASAGAFPQEPGAAGWERVTTSEALAAWEAAWAAAGSPTETRVFPAGVLANPALAFFGRRGGLGYDAGCIGNRSEGCTGLSNVFAPVPDLATFAAAAGQVASLAPGEPVVGYHRGAPLEAMRRVGFREVGRLRVWVTPP
jgi:hypothetical protein